MDQSKSRVDFGDLHRLTPTSPHFGFDRGMPIDRYYIESFLSANASDITGRVLEFADDRYVAQFGGDSVTQIDVLNCDEGNPDATIVADLCAGDTLPSDAFDSIICTQVLTCTYEVRQAIHTLHRILKPGGVLLATFSGISITKKDNPEQDYHEHWRFTSYSASRAFSEVFSERNVGIQTYGNVMAAIAFLHGLCAEDLETKELDYVDEEYEVLIAIRAKKEPASGANPFGA